jgi:hypothetical protein
MYLQYGLQISPELVDARYAFLPGPPRCDFSRSTQTAAVCADYLACAIVVNHSRLGPMLLTGAMNAAGVARGNKIMKYKT